MEHQKYIELKKELAQLKPNNKIAYGYLALFFAVTGLGIYLSTLSLGFWILGQSLLIVSYFQGQTLVHDMGHGFFFESKKVNTFWGHIVSLSPILPFVPWILIHGQHHRYSGNKYKDPTTSDKNYSDLTPKNKKIINLIWKSWIPVFVLSYSLSNFWNYPKLKRLFPKHAGRCLASIVFTLSFFASMIFIFGPVNFLKVWGVSYGLFLIICEPILFSQHVHIDQADKTDPDFNHESSYEVWKQDEFSRSLIFPALIRKYVLINFNLHGHHHVFPNLAGYYLDKIDEAQPNEEHWWDWYRKSKKTDAATLLFLTQSETGH
jgi:acyl-lipid omega-6 desaturase (Delta-12 desaturase)